MDIVNHKLENRLRMSIDYTIGLDAGTAILMKSDLIGRLESDKVWVGDHFDACYKMAGFFREKSDAFPLRVSGGVYQLLTAEHRLLCKWHDVRKFYHCNEPEVMLNHPAEVNYYTS